MTDWHHVPNVVLQPEASFKALADCRAGEYAPVEDMSNLMVIVTVPSMQTAESTLSHTYNLFWWFNH